MRCQLILVTLPNEDASALIVNGTTIYHEDDDPGHYQHFTIEKVAERLATALDTTVQHVTLSWDDVSKEEWNFDDVEIAALKKVEHPQL